MNVLVADGFYYQSDRRLICAIQDDLWYAQPETPGDMKWFPSPNIIRQPSQFKDYNEFLWYLTANFRKAGDYTLILDKERPGTELHLLSPIYMNHPSRLSDLTQRGITLNL